jgi:uncharacterized repeat protein (TIGR03803 family)
MHQTLRQLALLALVFTLAIAAHAQYTENMNIGNLPGLYPNGPLTVDAAGNFYGTLPDGGSGQCYPYGCGVVYELPAGSQTPIVLYNFTGLTDGGGPGGRLTFDSKGNLYGVAAIGGNLSGCFGQGCGVVYELSPSGSGWVETVLYNFNGGTDGLEPSAGVVFDAKGNLYGVTSWGGPNTCWGGQNCGIVYKLSPDSDGTWTETIIHTFTGKFDGGEPYGQLSIDSRGNLYGTAPGGGNLTACAPNGCGVIFRMAPSSGGTFTFSRLYAFNNTLGANPTGYLTFDKAGNIYGNAFQGGKTGSGCPFTYCGVTFELVRQSNGTWKYAPLYSFTGGSDGANPENGVTLDSSGNIYGTASYGGQQLCGGSGYSPGCGTAFEITAASGGKRTFNLIYSFSGFDGEIPNGSLLLDSSGNLFGTTVVGFTGFGNIIELSPPAAK